MDLEQEEKAVGPLRVTRNGRRYFGAEHKRRVVERCLAPGASVAAVALEHGFNANLVRKWVRMHRASQAGATAQQRLIPVSVVEVRSPEGASASKPAAQGSTKRVEPTAPRGAGLIEIQIGTVTVRLHGHVEASSLRTVLHVLGHAR